jgi:Protein of unknown function (DUF2934)
MNNREQQVRERAYYLWEAEGRPHGRGEIHWAMAEIATAVFSYLSLLEAERNARTVQEMSPVQLNAKASK